MALGLIISAMLELTSVGAEPFLRFERSQSLIYETDTIEVSTIRAVLDNRIVDYQIRYTWHKQIPDTTRTVITDSRKCPIIKSILTNIKTLSMPSPEPPEPGKFFMPPIDGSYYSLQSESSFPGGEINITSKDYTPLAEWISRALGSLEPCVQVRAEPPDG